MWIERKNFYLESEMLAAGWLNVYSSAKNGNMREEKVRNKFFRHLGIIRQKIIALEQVHQNKIMVVKKPIRARGLITLAGKDGVVIKSVDFNPAVIVFTADCLSIAAISPATGEYGIVHAGWRGLSQQIISGFLKNFSRPTDLIISLGPYIHKCCYAVSPEVGEKFGKFFNNGFLDLGGFARKELTGWKVKRIIEHPDCPGHQKKFFSYRRQNTTARQLNCLIPLQPRELSKWIN